MTLFDIFDFLSVAVKHNIKIPTIYTFGNQKTKKKRKLLQKLQQ